MGPLKNRRHEAFAIALFEGLTQGITQAEAYSQAGYTKCPKSAEVNACRLLKAVPEILQRIRELQAKAARKKQVTVEHIVERLDQASQLAERIEQPVAIVSAEVAKAKILGLQIDRVETGKPGDFSSATNTQELARLYIAKAIGLQPNEIRDHEIEAIKQEMLRHRTALVAIHNTEPRLGIAKQASAVRQH